MIQPFVPRAQPLRFVSLVNYATKPYNHDSKLLQDSGRSFDDIILYCKKFSITDNIRVQFTCDYFNDANNTVKLELYDYSATLISEITLTQNTISTGVFVYDALIDTSLLLGHYYCKLYMSGAGKPSYEWQTDYFEVGNFLSYPKIEYWGSDNDGLRYATEAFRFWFRIEALIIKYRIATETDTFELSNSTVINARTKTKRVTTFEAPPIPSYVCESLDLTFAHKKIYINGVEMVADSPAESEPIQNSIYYTYVRQLTESNYEIYEIEAASGGIPPPTGENYITSNGTLALSSDGTTYLIAY